MIKESIFDTAEIKMVKSQLLEIQEYLEEITFLENNKAALDKIKMEKEAA